MRKTIICILIISFLICGIAYSSLAAYTGTKSKQYFVRRMIFGNSAPATPEIPKGPTGGLFDRVRVGQEKQYTTTTTDSDGDDIAYFWDFGDDTDQVWSQTKQSGEVSWPAEHIWNEPGEYNVKVKARDDPNGDGNSEDGIESDWSDALTVKVLNKITVGKTQYVILKVNLQVLIHQQNMYFGRYQFR